MVQDRTSGFGSRVYGLWALTLFKQLLMVNATEMQEAHDMPVVVADTTVV
jgi:hypothetical protein